MTLAEEFKSRNFSKKPRCARQKATELELTRRVCRHLRSMVCRTRVHDTGEWWANGATRTGVLCIILCFALGIANLFHVNWVIAFSIVCLYVWAPRRRPGGSLIT